MFTANNNTVFYDKIDKLLAQYNNKRHSSIKIIPAEARKKMNEAIVYKNSSIR